MVKKKPLCKPNYPQPHSINVSFEENPLTKSELCNKIHQESKRSSKFPKNSAGYKKRKLKGHKNGMSKKKNKLEKISNTIQIVNIIKDSKGVFMAYCDYPPHKGVIGEQKLLNNGNKCFSCHYLQIFRPSKQLYSP